MIFIMLLIFIILLYYVLNKTRLKRINPNNLTFCIAIFIIFSVLQGFRAYSVGSDTLNYVKIYNYVKVESIKDIITKSQVNLEIGFQLLLKAFSLVHISDRGFLIIISILINFGFTYFIYKNSKSPLLSIIIFMGTEYFNLSFTALRQMLAVSIIVNTYPFLIKKEKIRPLCMILLAATIHRTAILFTLSILLQNVKMRKKTYIVGVIAFILLHIVGIPVLNQIIKLTPYRVYLKSNIVGSGINQLIVIMIYTAFGVYFKYKNNANDDYNLLIFFMIIAIFIQSITYRIYLIGRLIWYFYIYNTIYLPNIIMDIKDKKVRNISYLVIATLNIIQYIFFSMDMYNVVPYKF